MVEILIMFNTQKKSLPLAKEADLLAKCPFSAFSQYSGFPSVVATSTSQTFPYL